MNWLKLYTDVRTDLKLRTLSDSQFRVLIHLFCYVQEHDSKGLIDTKKKRLLAVEVAAGDVALLQETLEILEELDILTRLSEAEYQFVNWAKRQHIKPSDTPERVKGRVTKHRSQDDESETPCNAPVTPPPAVVTPLKHPVTPIEAEAEQSRADSDKSRAEAEQKGETTPSNAVTSLPSASLPAPAFEKSASAQSPPPAVPPKTPNFAPLPANDVQYLLKNGWTQAEIEAGCMKIRGRTDIHKPTALLHTKILPELRAKAPPSTPSRASPPPAVRTTAGTPEAQEGLRQMRDATGWGKRVDEMVGT